MKIQKFKIYENKEILSKDNIDFIKWCVTADKKSRYVYNEAEDMWLSLEDYSTYLTWEELYLTYISKKYNL